MTCQDSRRTYGLSRREALQIGVGMFGLTLPQALLAAGKGQPAGKGQAAGTGASSEPISCIFLFLAGGPSHFETFDPKPDAPVEIRGPWKPTRTSVPGTFICEKMPLMAQRMHQVAVIRSWQGKSGSHATGSQHVASGMYPPREGQYFPNFGCLVSALFGNRYPGVPAHFGLPVAARYTDPPGYLGAAHSAFNIKGDPTAPDLELAELKLPPGRFENRRSMLQQLDNLGRLASSSDPNLAATDKFSEEALALLTGNGMQRAMNLQEESPELRARYGQNIYGQRVLLGRRLIEAGARFVTINQAVQGGLFGAGQTNGTWDNHGWLFDSMLSFRHRPAAVPAGSKWHSYDGPGNLPQFDMSLSTLLDDLEDRGLLDTTLVVAMGEFGRTPKINKTAGRDHYPSAGSVVLAGAGIRRGIVVGATDRQGREPKTRPWGPEDIAASIYHALGLNPHRTYFPRLPRPTPIAGGEVISELFA